MANLLPNIKISSLHDAIDLAKGGHIAHVVSTVDPVRAKTLHKLADRHLILAFCDQEIGDYEAPPNQTHIKQFIRWVDQHQWNNRETILFHCHAGICRSTAMTIGFIIHLLRKGGWEIDQAVDFAFDRVLRLRPQAWPNFLVLRLFDEVLELNGELIDHAVTWRKINVGKFMI
jgi:predicted protein tyrosine phosphatase